MRGYSDGRVFGTSSAVKPIVSARDCKRRRHVVKTLLHVRIEETAAKPVTDDKIIFGG